MNQDLGYRYRAITVAEIACNIYKIMGHSVISLPVKDTMRKENILYIYNFLTAFPRRRTKIIKDSINIKMNSIV